MLFLSKYEYFFCEKKFMLLACLTVKSVQCRQHLSIILQSLGFNYKFYIEFLIENNNIVMVVKSEKYVLNIDKVSSTSINSHHPHSNNHLNDATFHHWCENWVFIFSSDLILSCSYCELSVPLTEMLNYLNYLFYLLTNIFIGKVEISRWNLNIL